MSDFEKGIEIPPEPRDDSESSPETKEEKETEKPWNGLVYDKFFEYTRAYELAQQALSPDKPDGGKKEYAEKLAIAEEKKKAYLESLREMQETICRVVDKDFEGGKLITFLATIIEQEPSSREELEHLIGRALKDKKILEIGPKTPETYSNSMERDMPKELLFLKQHGAEVVGIGVEPHIEEFGKEIDVPLLQTENTYSGLKRAKDDLNQHAPFDAIYSSAVGWGKRGFNEFYAMSNRRLAGSFAKMYHDLLRENGVCCHQVSTPPGLKQRHGYWRLTETSDCWIKHSEGQE